jgi:hypothetical protein
VNLAEMQARATLLDELPNGRELLADVLELTRREQAEWKPRLARTLFRGEPQAADGIYYVDTRPPWILAAEATATLLTTDVLIWQGSRTALPAGYFAFPGKAVRLTVYGSITTALTPGNIGVELYYGTTSAGGTLLASSAALALVASQTTVPFRIEAYARARAVGTSGSLLPFAVCKFGIAVIASPNDHFIVPAGAPTAVTVDTTAASGFNVQIKRSGSTAETVTVHDLVFEALN